jgi:exodeoxyribonuclease V gamma subunit
MMFSVTFSNRFENLLDALLERLDVWQGGQGPFARAQVIVPGSALRRRVELALADRAGVCAGVDFDTLGRWLWRQIGHVVEAPPDSPYAPPALVWRMFAALDGDWARDHARLARYLEGADARRRFEFAGRLARLFDHYLCYRPMWLERWAAGEPAFTAREEALRADEGWQGALWRHIHAGERPPALPFMDFLRRAARMDDAGLAQAGLPDAVSVFCLPSLPPLYLEVLRALARTVDVRLYVLNPCREYWFEIVDARRLSWLARQQRDLFHETGNTLLASWGKQAQAQIESLFEGEHPILEDAVFAPGAGSHLLARLHRAILDLRELEPGSIRLDHDDRSIELHRCHSRIRELEVLHDRLLGLFRGPNPPRPDEIAILMPDLDVCAPLIEAVFGTAPPERHIPWRITGLGRVEENPVARLLDDLLVLAAGRAPASRVFDLLQQPLVAAHFGLDEAGLEQIRVWMDRSGIRWGLDAEQARAAFASGGHTVETGLSRLFLSWAAGEHAGRALFIGQTGVEHAPQGSDGLILGAFWRYARCLGRLRAELLQAHDAEGWRALLLGALAELVGEADGFAEEMRDVREAIKYLADDIAAGLGRDASIALPLDIIHPALLRRFDEGAHGGVPGGAVTFSALSSLRGLSYRVVCVIGLDRDAFPGREHADEFDLMAARPQKGDRQRRDDERNLFLDVVLAAREVLHLSCVGRSIRDNTALPPSVLVDELFDALAIACAEHPEESGSLEAARARLTVEHPLQAFSPDYFVAGREARLENFRGEFAAALSARARHRQDDAGRERPFFAAPLPSPPEDWRCVDLAQLKRFFAHPCHFLLRERLGLDLSSGEEELTDAEIFVPGRAARTALAARLLPVLLADEKTAEEGGVSDEELLALARAGGEYPVGSLGDGALGRELATLRKFAGRVSAARAGPKQPVHALKLDFDLDGESWELRAAFGALRPEGQVYYRYDVPRARDFLAVWLDHLALCAAPPSGLTCRSQALLRDEDFSLRPLPESEARAHLAEYLALYRAGLREPLRFFPKAAWEYASHDDPFKAREAARKEWDEGNFPEKNDLAYRIALRGMDDVLGDTFRENAETLFGALREALECRGFSESDQTSTSSGGGCPRKACGLALAP